LITRKTGLPTPFKIFRPARQKKLPLQKILGNLEAFI
jgi:hypothetical protein